MAEFEQVNTAFLAWLAANGATVSKSIALQDYSAESAGRGVVAVADINVNHETKEPLLKRLYDEAAYVTGLPPSFQKLFGD